MSATPSVKSLAGVWIALLVLLGLTTASAWLNMGIGNTLANFGIAVIKVALIGTVFMHLRVADAVVRIVAGAAIFFLFILAFLTFGDVLTRPTTESSWKAPVETDTGPY